MIRTLRPLSIDDGPSGFVSNYIRTTKYTFATFLPVCLLLQFTKLSNLYFLVVATLQSIPAISPLEAKTAVIPLAVVVLISMAREAIEDFLRARSDIKQNS